MSSNQPSYHNFEIHSLNSGLDAELAHHTHRSRGGKCCSCGCGLGCLALLLLLAGGAFAFWYCFFSGGAPLVVSPETTIITEPLKSDGKTVDFHQAIQKMIEPDVRANENGFRDILIGYGRQVFEVRDNSGNTDWQYREMCDRLGIDPLTPPEFPLNDPHKRQMMVNIEHEGPGLDAVQIAVAKPHYFIPLVRENEKTLVASAQPVAVYAFHKTLSDLFRLRAEKRFHPRTTDIDGAWKDTLASLRLFRRATVNHAWIQALGGSDDESLLCPVANVIATLPQWSPEQLGQAIKDLESLPDWQDRKMTLKMIQFTVLDVLSATGDFADLEHRLGLELPADVKEMLPGLQFVGFDWNLVAKELNGAVKDYEERVKKAEGKSPGEQEEELGLRGEEKFSLPWNTGEWQDKINDDPSLFFSAAGRSKLVGFLAGGLTKSMSGEMYRLQLLEDSRCQALRIVLALERFRREHQQYPNSLEELGLKPMRPDMHLEYEKAEDAYLLGNEMFELE